MKLAILATVSVRLASSIFGSNWNNAYTFRFSDQKAPSTDMFKFSVPTITLLL